MCYRDKVIRYSFDGINCHKRAAENSNPELSITCPTKTYQMKPFRECLLEIVSKEVYVNDSDRLQRFRDVSLQVLNQLSKKILK